MSGSLSAVLLRTLPGASGAVFTDHVALELRLLDLVQAAQRAWPQLHNDPEDFIGHLASRAPAGDDGGWLERVRVSDLWLAFACARGDAAAIQAFEREFEADLKRSVNRFAKSASDVEELRQVLRTKLFVGGSGTTPKIASYSGGGFLQNWLRVTAARTFIDAGRGATPDVPLERAYEDGGDFEVDFLKSRYRADFKEAFAQAIAALTPAERGLLRYRIRGLTVDQIAKLEAVHRATAARRVAKAREQLLAHTRERLGVKLAVQRTELDSIMMLIHSRLDVSLERLLATDEE